KPSVEEISFPTFQLIFPQTSGTERLPRLSKILYSKVDAEHGVSYISEIADSDYSSFLSSSNMFESDYNLSLLNVSQDNFESHVRVRKELKDPKFHSTRIHRSHSCNDRPATKH
ncbi:unnamed protein product, partial [Didymodactylos carnosus]